MIMVSLISGGFNSPPLAAKRLGSPARFAIPRPLGPGNLFDPKQRTIFGPRFASVVELGRRDIGMAKQLLDFGNISIMEQRIRRCRRTQGMCAKTRNINSEFLRVTLDFSVHPIGRDRTRRVVTAGFGIAFT